MPQIYRCGGIKKENDRFHNSSSKPKRKSLWKHYRQRRKRRKPDIEIFVLINALGARYEDGESKIKVLVIYGLIKDLHHKHVAKI